MAKSLFLKTGRPLTHEVSEGKILTARKPKTRPLEDMLSLVALMPWWVGVAIAAVGNLVLHRMATPPQVTALHCNQVRLLVLWPKP
jgi:hypothetical protein